MQKLITLVFGVLVSMGAIAQGYERQGGYDFDVVASVATGKIDFEELNDNEEIHSMALSFDFRHFPMELEVKYFTVGLNQSAQNIGIVGDVESAEGKMDGVGLSAKLDLIWSCTKGCVYLIAGYNKSELSVEEINTGNVTITGIDDIDGDFAHFGLGMRYDFSNSARINVDCVSYQIGDQEGIDFGNATSCQVGAGYRF